MIKATGNYIIQDFYKLSSDVIGKGSRSTVVKGTHVKTKQEVAVKIIERN
jgi:hypothetical protein